MTKYKVNIKVFGDTRRRGFKEDSVSENVPTRSLSQSEKRGLESAFESIWNAHLKSVQLVVIIKSGQEAERETKMKTIKMRSIKIVVLSVVFILIVLFTACSTYEKEEIETIGVLEAKSNGDLIPREYSEEWDPKDLEDEWIHTGDELEITPEMAVEIANIHFKHHYGLEMLASTEFCIDEVPDYGLYIVSRIQRERVLGGGCSVVIQKKDGAIIAHWAGE